MVDLADYIRIAEVAPALRFLIIGGYAVAAHGHTRATFDVDFLVQKSNRDEWKKRTATLGLQIYAESDGFIQFQAGKDTAGDFLDLMLVSDATFAGMWASSEVRKWGAIEARVPCLDHLLALKLHSLRQIQPQRTSKDADDIECLVRRNRLDLKESKYESLFLKHGNRDLYELFLRLLTKS